MAGSLKPFDDMFKILTMSLRFNRSHPDIPRDNLWKFQFLIITAISFTTVYFLVYAIMYHDVEVGDFAEACKNGTIVIVYFNVTLKYFTLLKHQEAIKAFIKLVDRDYVASRSYCEEDKKIILHYALKGTTVCRFWYYNGIAVIFIFPFKALLIMIHNYMKGEFKLVHMFEVTYPEPIESNKQNPIVYLLLFALSFSFSIYASSMYVGFNPLVPICLLHVCGQLGLLSRRLETLFVEFEDPREIEEQLKIIIIQLQGLYKFVDDIKACFTILYECNIKATTIILPLAAFLIIEDLRHNWINLEFVTVMVASILYFFMPSYYSDLLMDKSEELRQAIYSSGWQNCSDKRVRQIILFMITRARTPMGIRTVFNDINLDTFAKMCNQSFGIFNVMNAALR